MKLFLSLPILIFLFSCSSEEINMPVMHSFDHLKYFGFTIIDTYWDDPSDAEEKLNYADEIHTFCNIADMLVINPEDDIKDRLQIFSAYKLKTVLHLNEIFFQLVNDASPSGSNYDLRQDFKERWTSFTTLNSSVLNSDYIGAFYIGEEPTWNGITYEELNMVAELLKASFPKIPLMIIEAYPSLNDLIVPESIDWVGFDRYFIKDPLSSDEFKANWTTLLSKLTTPSQKIMVIMDAHYIDFAHGTYGGIQLNEMDKVAYNYFELAKSESRVIGVLGYFWPNGFDFETSIGARGMPQNVLEAYVDIGKNITGK